MALKKQWDALCLALSLFTIIPMGKREMEKGTAAFVPRYLPLAGIVAGIVTAATAYGAFYFALPAPLGCGLMLAAGFGITGFIHLDGFMDCCDALFSHRDRERKREILKDSHTGAFAVIGFGCLLVVLWGAYAALYPRFGGFPMVLIFIAAPFTARALAALLLMTTPAMEGSGLAAAMQGGGKLWGAFCILAGLVGLYMAAGLPALIAAGCAFAVALLGLRQCLKDFGGLNGDVCGFSIVLWEAVFMVALAILLSQGRV